MVALFHVSTDSSLRARRPTERQNPLMSPGASLRAGPTCFRAFLPCFCEGEMSLAAGTRGEEQRGWGEEGGSGSSLVGTEKHQTNNNQMST